jgi:poly-gamma-glutamate capsule biosynthesis protein CapA/YwtB (metallophosphatase superfamily)
MKKNLIIMAVGDVGLGGGSGEFASVCVPITNEKLELLDWLNKVAPVLQKGDFVIGNLEGVICQPIPTTDSKAGMGVSMFRMPSEAAEVLKKAGFNAIALANNHAMDYGPEGMLQTLDNLSRVGIAYTGGGRNIREARKPAVLERAGVKLAILSYSSVFIPGVFPAGESKPGIATVTVSTSYQIPGNILYAPGVPPRIITTPKCEDREKMEEDVRRAIARADVVVVNWHWGLTKSANAKASGLPMEDSLFYVLNYQEDMGRAAIDAGADLIIGHHPHRLQGIETYKGKVICYSLGNLSMPFSMGVNFGLESVILKGYIDRKTKQLTRVTMIPVMATEETLQPYPVPISEAGGIINELQRLSKKYGTKFRAKKSEIAIQAA